MLLPNPIPYLPRGLFKPSTNNLRVVDRVLIGKRDLTGVELLHYVVDNKTKYLVLDLDKTVHRNRNIGELLAWELNAFECYGKYYKKLNQGQYRSKKIVLFWRHPLLLLKYVCRAVNLWLIPGLYYLILAKWFMNFSITRKWVYKHFGPDPIALIQEYPRLILQYEISRYPKSLVLQLTRNIWQRFSGDQVFLKQDIDKLRQRFLI